MLVCLYFPITEMAFHFSIWNIAQSLSKFSELRFRLYVSFPLLTPFRKMKMVDIVAQKMPSESDVHMARSFLTKILRSSMRYRINISTRKPTSFPVPPSLVMMIYNHISSIRLVISSIRSSNFHPLVFHLAYALLSSFRVPTIMKCLEISLDFKIVISRPGKS